MSLGYQLTSWLDHALATKAKDAPVLSTLQSPGGIIEIRNGRPTDVPAIVPMIEQACLLHQNWDPARFGFVDDAVPMYRRWITKLVDDQPGSLLIASTEARPVAFLVGTIERTAPIYRISRYGFIRELWIETEYRRMTVGRNIVRAAIENFRRLGIEHIRLETAAANEAARAFFASCGFRASTAEMLLERS